MKKFVSRNFFPIFLIAISIVLCVANYTPGTILSGWDTLHPEFNFPEYLKRIFFGVWQSHQGLGALSTQAHASELPRMILYYPLSFLLPLSFLRYSYFFLTLILGSLGVYFFIKKAILREDSTQNKIGSFGGALFYLLNLGTVQHYFVPLEMFATHFATLGWVFLFAVRFLEKSYKKDLFIFAVITFFTASIAHTPTLWYVYLFSLLLFLTTFNLIARTKQIFVNSLKIFLVTIFVNLFWILPDLYFIATSAKAVTESKIHSLFSQEAFAKNKEFGTIPDILIFKNFLFDWNQYLDNGKFGPVLSVWIDHLNRPFVLLIGYGLSLIAIIGLVISILKKHALSISLLAILLLSVFFLLTTNPPLGFLFQFLQNNISFFKEAIRFPFTKFSILFMFVFSIYFAWGLAFLTRKFKLFPLIIFFICIIYYMLPAFQGNLISPTMKVRIPPEYLSLFEWFNSQQQGRIATLPIQSFWGWNYYNWGYQGAGFLWFGLKNPVLEREFDRWNPNNEQYYREMSQAIYRQNLKELENVIKKYDIQYILLDKSIIAPEQGTNSQILFFNEIENMLTNSTILQHVFQSGNLLVYSTNTPTQNVRIIKNPSTIEPSPSVFYDDYVYSKYGDYITYSDSRRNEIMFSFRDIIDNQNRLISEIPSSLLLDKELSVSLNNARTSNDCPLDGASQNNIKEIRNQFLRYSSADGPFCDHFSVPDLPLNQGYLVSITSRNIKGLPLRLCIVNYISKRCDLFTNLADSKDFKEELFLLPPISEGVGIDVNFNNFAVKKSPSVNDIQSIKIIPFPYAELSQIEHYSPAADFQETNILTLSQSFDKGWKAYEVKNYELGIMNWFNNVFPFVSGRELKEHVLVNNWANGWVIDSEKLKVKSEKLIVVFWPQYLEYLGFVFLIATFVWLAWSAIKREERKLVMNSLA